MTIKQGTSQLINTSVEDMKSSLKCAYEHGELKESVLLEAYQETSRRGEKTKAMILLSFLRKAGYLKGG